MKLTSTSVYALSISLLTLLALQQLSATFPAGANALNKRINLKFSAADGSTTSSAELKRASLTKKALSSKLPLPSQKDIDEVMAASNRVRIFEGGAINGKPLSKKVMLDSSDPKVLDALSKALKIDEDESSQEISLGGPTIELLNQKKRLAVLSFHRGETISWEKVWRFDANLHYGRRLLDWFADNGIEGPRVAFEAELKDKRRTSADLQKWLMSMPDCLRTSWSLVVTPGMSDMLIFSPLPDNKLPLTVLPIEETPRLKEIMAILDNEFTDPEIKALALLQWYASGVGTWTGFPSYEELPAQLLLTMPSYQIIDALHQKNVSEPELEGAARYFASHILRVSKPQDLQLLDSQLKQRLLQQSLKSEDSDKRYRAESAFNSTFNSTK